MSKLPRSIFLFTSQNTQLEYASQRSDKKYQNFQGEWTSSSKSIFGIVNSIPVWCRYRPNKNGHCKRDKRDDTLRTFATGLLCDQ